MASLEESLNVHLADWNVLYTKLHHYHWFVAGPHFLSLHEKFEELYGFAAEALDEFAERILAMGGKPLSSLKQYLEKAQLAEAGGETTDFEMVQAIVADFRKLANGLKATLKQSDQAGDPVTSDLLTDYAGKLEKQTWMLAATAKQLATKA